MAMVDAKYKWDVTVEYLTAASLRTAHYPRLYVVEALIFPLPNPFPGRETNVPYDIVADDAFPLSKHIMKPFPFRNQPGTVRVFNYRLSRARRIVENAFGILANVFRVFRKPILIGPDKTEVIVLAACALHNFLFWRTKNPDAPPGTFDEDDTDTSKTHSAY